MIHCIKLHTDFFVRLDLASFYSCRSDVGRNRLLSVVVYTIVFKWRDYLFEIEFLHITDLSKRMKICRRKLEERLYYS